MIWNDVTPLKVAAGYGKIVKLIVETWKSTRIEYQKTKLCSPHYWSSSLNYPDLFISAPETDDAAAAVDGIYAMSRIRVLSRLLKN